MTILAAETTKTGPNIKGGVVVYTVRKDLTDAETEAFVGKYPTDSTFRDVLRHDADVYTEDGRMLLRFRKGVLPRANVRAAYRNLIEHVRGMASHTRGAATGRSWKESRPIKSTIYGYFDQLTVMQKHMLKKVGLEEKAVFPYNVRVTSFTMTHPDRWARVLPLIRDIDALYRELAPEHHAFQESRALETAFHITATAFSTVTANLNTQMACHRDRGNLPGSFGNLVVVEKGRYQGGHFGYPQYGIAVDVRAGDFLACDVQQVHGNSPIRWSGPDAERLSLVCYLRKRVWEKSRGSAPADVRDTVRRMGELYEAYGWKAPEPRPHGPTRQRARSDDELAICIPSFERPRVCNDQTLRVLQEAGVPARLVHVFVADGGEHAAYSRALDRSRYGSLVVGRKGLVPQKEFIAGAFPEGQRIVYLDDDLKAIDLSLSDRFRGVGLLAFFDAAFEECARVGAHIWGVYPVYNPRFRRSRPEVYAGLSFLVGGCCGVVNRPRDPRLRLRLTREDGVKEDVERSIRYYLRDGSVVRFNRVAYLTHYYKATGGLGGLEARIGPSAAAAERLKAAFPDLGDVAVRPNGMTEFRLRRALARAPAGAAFLLE